MITTKRVYEAASAEDGTRVLIDRLWPRGLTKAAARVDLWLRELAPSDELRKWYGHLPERYAGFRERYRHELEGHAALLDELAARSRTGRVTLVFAAKDAEHCNAGVLREFLEDRRPRRG